MRYLFTILFAIAAACFTLAFSWTVYLGFVDSWEWFLVSIGILMPNVVLVLITSASFLAAKEY